MLAKRRLPVLDYSKSVKIELGCGTNRQKGYIGLDMWDYGQEIVWDIAEGLPFPDGSIDEIVTQHCLEHLTCEELDTVWKEVYRVLRVGALWINSLPHRQSPEAWWWCHKSYWDETTITSANSSDHWPTWKWEIVKNQKEGNQLFFTLRKLENK